MADRLTGVVREKGGLLNGTPGVATATGDLSGTYFAQTDRAKTYGRFTIGADGAWTYTLDDSNADVQALSAGEVLHELVTVKTTAGPTQVIDITIKGANDFAVITGTAARSVREKGGLRNATAGVATATGDLNATDVDDPATFVAQSNVAMRYGRFTINSSGTWSYALNDSNRAVQALNAGQVLHELVTVKTADGTAKVIDITIQGANDVALVSGTAAGSVTEKSGVRNGTAGVAIATGDLNVTDVDNPATFVAQSNVAKRYGRFTIGTDGVWTYTLNDTNRAVQALNAGGVLHELVTVKTADGTAKVIDITIKGANDAPLIRGTAAGSVTEKSGVANGTAGIATATGDLSVSDIDNPATFVAQSNALKAYGRFTIDAAGTWTYTLTDSNAAVQALNTGGTLHDLVTVKTADGTAKVINITIKGANDAAVITGTTTGSVTEKSGASNGTAGVAAATGDLNATDVDSATTFVAQSNLVKTYGRFTINTAGTWTYTLDDANADVQALNTGGTLHDLVTVKTADGTAKVIDVTIHGANDAAVITGTATGSVTEKSGVANGTAGTGSATGDLNATDIDSATTFTAQSNVAKTYGTFSIDSAGGWSYTLDDANTDVQALNTGGTLDELVTVTTADGTAKVIDITINGANDAAVITGTDTGSVTEKGGFGNAIPGVASATGDLNATDVDSATTFVVQTNAAKSYGTFSIDATGAWTYTLDDGNADVQALDVGDTLHELVTVATADGTSRQIDITINGAGDTGFDLTYVTPAVGLVIQGDAADDRTGSSVSSAGDVNGDGFVDLIVGAPYGNDGGSNAGEAYVVFGKATGFGTVDGSGRAVLDLTSLSPADGFVIQGDVAGDYAGYSVSAAGDINGDGFADVIVGARGDDDGGSFAGAAYVVFGGASGFGTVDGAGRAVVDLTSFSPAQGFIVQGDAAGDETGISVSSAGDVNGDGIADLIVGARYGNGGGSQSGEAYVVFGKASGFGTVDGTGRSVVDLTNLLPANGFIVQGDAAGDEAGISVSSAGDVNGDGIADLIVGARGGDDGGSNAGEAYVVFGTVSGFGTVDGTGRAVVDLTTLVAANGFVVQGDAATDWAGFGVSTAGDVNGDGFADIIVGAPLGDDAGFNAGEAYVVFGKATGFGTVDGAGRSVIDLTALAPTDGFIVQGDAPGNSVGSQVSSAGDFNGDGFADLIVGAPSADGDAGKSYVVFGKASGLGTVDGTGRSVIDLANLDDADGFVIAGDEAGDASGRVGSAGDVNGDGFADLIVGAKFGGDGDVGAAYVLFGGAFGGSTTPVTTTGSSAAEILIGGAGDDTLSGVGGADSIRGGAGNDALSVGDTTFRNVDGGGGRDTLGLAGAGLTLDLSDRTQAAKIAGIEQIDLTGTGDNSLTLDRLAVLNEVAPDGGVAHVLRVNGDTGDTVSFAETQWANDGTLSVGGITYERYVNGDAEVQVEQGVAVSFPSVFDLTSLTPAQGFIIQGDAAGDIAGRSVSSAGDVNGDGFADLIVGAPIGNGGGASAGEAYVVFGGASGFGTVDGSGRSVLDLSTLSPAGGFIIQGDAAGDVAGTSVSSAGDVNGDGFADLIVGAPLGADGGSAAGEAYVVFGTASGFGTVDGTGRAVIDLTTLDPAGGFVVQGDAALDRAGWSVSSAGDVNGDGLADLMVGAPQAGSAYAGATYVVFGKASGLGTVDGTGRAVIDLTTLSPTDGFVIEGDAVVDRSGYSVASAGDVNGDGFADLIVGAPFGADGGSQAGEAYVVFGKASGFGTVDGTGRSVIDLSTLSPTDGFIIQADYDGDQAGWSASSAGDVNGDGFADLIVGAPLGDDGGTSAGEAYVIFGKASGFGTVDGTSRAVVDLTTLDPADGFVIQGDSGGDQAGWSVSSAGDFNGDGFADLIVGAPLGDDGGTYAGEAYVVFGKATGFGSVVSGRSVIDLTTLAPADGFIIQGDAADDQAGRSASSAGDVNGDGFADLIVGAPSGDDGGNSAGEVYVVFGTDSGFGTVDGTGRAVLDLASLDPAEGFIIQGDAAGDQAGFSVASAGDVNGDGLVDLIVGARLGDDGGIDAGEAYVLFGKASGFGAVDGSGRSVVDLTSLTPAEGFIIQGDAADDRAGASVSSAGDVNGDGFADLIVGAVTGDDGGSDAGEAYVLFGGEFGGATAPVTTTGSGAAEILLGGLGDDTLTGGGGADSIRGGAGDDTLSVPDLAFRSIDGGGGSDTLVLTGAGQDFDFTALADSAVANVETLDITGSGDNDLTLAFADVAALNDGDPFAFTAAGSHHALVIEGDAGDTLTLQDYDPDGAGGVDPAAWTLAQAGVNLDGSAGGGYDIYDLVRGSDILASVAVDADISKI